MPSAFERALQLSHKVEKRLAYVDVVYARPGQPRLPMRLVLAESRVESADFAENVKVVVRVRDYIITAAELVLGGELTKPEAGDQILEVVGDETFVQELKPLAGSGNVWDWHGPIKDAYRVHTKHSATES